MTAETPTPDTPATSPRYCRRCNYNLAALATLRCPECGHPFDPANPRTTLARPRRHWLRHLRRAAYAILSLCLLLAAVWGWFYWGWHDEQQTLIALRLNPLDPFQVMYTPILTPWPKENLGPAGFVLDRVERINLPARAAPADLAPLARLTHLQWLEIAGTRVTDVTALARLTNLQNLQHLDLSGTGVTDLAPLARLTNLRELYLDRTGVTDLAPLVGLTNLQVLMLRGTGVTDLAPLARLTNLQGLSLVGTGVTNLAALGCLKSLRRLAVPKETITEAQVDALRRDLPDCTIHRL